MTRVCPQCGFDWSVTDHESLEVVPTRRTRPENLSPLAVDPDAGFTPWREHDTMAARSASPMSVRVGLWALAVASGDWTRSVHEAPPDVSAWHPDMGWVNRGHVL